MQAGKRSVVAGDCNNPNVLRLPFRLELKATARKHDIPCSIGVSTDAKTDSCDNLGSDPSR